MAVLRTVDPEMGIVALHISPGCENEVETLLGEMKKEIMLENLDPKGLYNLNSHLKGDQWERD